MAAPGSVIWITGASSGMGRALTILLVGDGNVVAGSANDPAGLDEVTAETRNLPGRFFPLPLDIRDADAIREAIRSIETEIGPVETAVLAAGIHLPVTGDDPDPAIFRKVAEVNLFGTIECLSAILAPMRERKRGRIAVVASLSGYIGQHRYAAYGMTKAALINLTQSLYPDLARFGIKLQLVTPGFVHTPMTRKYSAHMLHAISAEEAARRIRAGMRKDAFEISFPRRLSWAVRLLRMLPLQWAQAVNDGARRRRSTGSQTESNGVQKGANGG